MNRKPYIAPTRITRPTKGFVCSEGRRWLQLCRQNGTVTCGHESCVCNCEMPIVRRMTSDEVIIKLADLQYTAAGSLNEICNNW